MEAQVNQQVLELVGEYATPDRPVYLVGGAVRDRLLSRPVHDLDFTLPGPTRSMAREIANRLGGAFYVMDEARDTNRVVLPVEGAERLLLDFATLRSGDLEGDLRGRDFTVNALAYNLAQPNRLIDLLGGLADLRHQRIRACSESSLSDDPARVLRGARLAVSLGFRIQPETLALMRAAAPLLARVSAERQRDELFAMLEGTRAAQSIMVLDQLGALAPVLPELETLKGVAQGAPHVYPVWEHTLSVLRHLERLFALLVDEYHEDEAADLMSGLAVMRLGRFRQQLRAYFAGGEVAGRTRRGLLFLAALYHDIAKPQTQTVDANGKIHFLGHPQEGAGIMAARSRALALSGDETVWLEVVVRAHMRVHFLSGRMEPHASDVEVKVSRRSIYRFFRATGDAGIAICLLSLADTRATGEATLKPEDWQSELDVCRALLEAYFEQTGEVVAPQRFVDGNDLMRAFSLKPGPAIGRLLEAIREGQAAGEVGSREDALRFARRWLEESAVSHNGKEEDQALVKGEDE